MATPRTIALFDASPQAGRGPQAGGRPQAGMEPRTNGEPQAGGEPTPAGALLADLEDALPAYDRISARALGVRDGEPPRMVWLAGAGESAAESGESAAAGANGLAAAGAGALATAAADGLAAGAGALATAEADVLVIGCALDGDGLRRAADELGRLAGARSICSGCRVFALGTCAAHDASGADGLQRLADACGELSLTWCGGLVAAGSLTIPGSAGKPRMGRARRTRSEAIDQLIAAVRAGLSIWEAAELFGWGGDAARCGVIVSRCPLPRALYRILHGPSS